MSHPLEQPTLVLPAPGASSQEVRAGILMDTELLIEYAVAAHFVRSGPPHSGPPQIDQTTVRETARKVVDHILHSIALASSRSR